MIGAVDCVADREFASALIRGLAEPDIYIRVVFT